MYIVRKSEEYVKIEFMIWHVRSWRSQVWESQWSMVYLYGLCVWFKLGIISSKYIIEALWWPWLYSVVPKFIETTLSAQDRRLKKQACLIYKIYLTFWALKLIYFFFITGECNFSPSGYLWQNHHLPERTLHRGHWRTCPEDEWGTHLREAYQDVRLGSSIFKSCFRWEDACF